MDIKKSSLLVAASDGSSLQIDCLTIGTGAPRTLLLSGIHGNEKTGQIVIAELLKKELSFSGTLTIVPIANPTGFLKNTREESISGLDLNRHFFDANTNTGTAIIETLTQLAKQHDFVIDLHNFTTEGFVQVVSNHIGGSDYLATLFNPDVVRSASEEQKIKRTGTLARYLKEANVPYVLIELPVDTKVSPEYINRIVMGLLSHLKECSSYSKLTANSFNQIQKVVIRPIKSEMTGVFERNAQFVIGANVSQGEIIGTIENNQGTLPIYSSHAGVVCEMDNDEQRTVSLGSTLIAIGEPV